MQAYIYIGEGVLRLISPMPASVLYYWPFDTGVLQAAQTLI